MVSEVARRHPGVMSEYTTHIPEVRRLQRSRSDRMLAGVSGGLARYFEIHPAVFRVGFVVLTLLGGAGILIYAAAALVIPDEGKEDSIATAALRNRRDRPWPLIGLGLLAVAGAILLSRATLWPDGDSWWLFLIAGVLILWITRQPAADPAVDAKELAAEDSRRVRRALRRVGIVVASLVALVVVAAAIFMAVFDVHLGRGVGDRIYVRHDHAGAARRLPAGDRLARARPRPSCSSRRARRTSMTSVDVGDLHVIVPAGVALRAHGEAQVGNVELLGTQDDGRNADVDVSRDRRAGARARRGRRRGEPPRRAGRRTMTRHVAAHVRVEL